MATVTGTLYDISGSHLAGKNPEIVFALNETGGTQNGIYVTEPSRITPGGDGSFTAELPSTDLMRDDSYYTLSIEWQDEAGKPSRIDYPDWCIRIPTSGGPIGDLRGPGSNMSIVYVSLTAPDRPVPYLLWLEQDPADTTNPANTGKLYRWENI